MTGPTESRSDLELLWTELQVLWQLDNRHRLHGPHELVITAAAGGLTAAVAAGMSGDLAAQLTDLVDRSTPAGVPTQPPPVVQRCRDLLDKVVPGQLTLSGGPSYLVTSPLPRMPVAVLRSDSPQAPSVRYLRPETWQPQEWDELVGGGTGAPWAMVVQDEQVVSVCHTPRRSPAGAEAGTWTDPAFRGRGYAAAATAAWAEVLARTARTCSTAPASPGPRPTRYRSAGRTDRRPHLPRRGPPRPDVGAPPEPAHIGRASLPLRHGHPPRRQRDRPQRPQRRHGRLADDR